MRLKTNVTDCLTRVSGAFHRAAFRASRGSVLGRAGGMEVLIHPAWYLNLRAKPDVEITRGDGVAKPMRARVATADERAELWPVLLRRTGYDAHQQCTSREIPLVVLEPR